VSKRVDMEEIERKARAATQGRWVWGKGNVEGSRGRVNCLYVDDPERQRPVIALDVGSLYTTLANDCDHIAAASPPVMLALIAHIRDLRAALVRAAELTEGTVSCETQCDCAEDDPDWQEAQRWRELVTRGPVLP
jgi:hypothetical protein